MPFSPPQRLPTRLVSVLWSALAVSVLVAQLARPMPASAGAMSVAEQKKAGSGNSGTGVPAADKRSRSQRSSRKTSVRRTRRRLRDLPRRGAQIRERLRRAGAGQLSAALKSLADPTLPATKRRAILAQASGRPLTDVTVAFLQELAALVPDTAFEEMGERAEEIRRDTGDVTRRSWFGTFVPDNFRATGRAIDEFARAAEDPEFRTQVDRALDVLRVAGRVEAEHLQHLAAYVRPGQWPEIRRALARHGIEVARTVMSEVGLRPPGGAERQAVDELLDSFMGIAEAGLDPDLSSAQRNQALASAIRRAKERASRVATVIGRARPRSADLLSGNWQRVGNRLAVQNRRLLRTLQRSIDTTPEGREAMRALAKDLELAGRFSIGLARIVGAASNDEMPAAERAQTVKAAAESMGPLFVKMIQTAVNQVGGLEMLGLDGEGQDSVVIMALRELQDRVTPMSKSEVRSQIRRSLGRDVESIFEEFDDEPIASASIAQVHRARLRVGKTRFSNGRLIEVAVKIQRPNLKRDFEDAVRASSLAMSVVRESLDAFGMLDREGVDRERVQRSLDFVDNSMADFIQSFEVETDFEAEAREMRRFARELGGELDIYVPEVFSKHSSKEVMVMEYVRGDKLSAYGKRVAAAQQARLEPMDDGPLPDVAPERAAESRARAYARRTYGLEARSATTSKTRRGYAVRVQFDSDVQRTATIEVNRDGSVKARGRVPDLSGKGAAELRDRLLGTFVTQMLVNRHLHGDLHQGNFVVLPDGKSVAVFDYGQMVTLANRHFLAPAQFTVGLWRRNSSIIAGSLVRMSEQYRQLSPAKRRQLTRKVAIAVEEALASHEEVFSVDALGEVVLSATSRSGLTLSPTYLQWIKTGFAMSGNLLALSKIADRGMSLKTARSVLGRTARSSALADSPLGELGTVIKRRRVRRGQAEARGE